MAPIHNSYAPEDATNLTLPRDLMADHNHAGHESGMVSTLLRLRDVTSSSLSQAWFFYGKHSFSSLISYSVDS